MTAPGGAILCTLGAGRRQLTVLQLAEFLAIGLLSGAIGVAMAGFLGTRRAINSPPLQTIRAVT